MPYGFLYIIFLVALALLPSLIWLAYFLKRDDQPEPRIRLIITFCLGVLITYLASYLENLIGNWAHNISSPNNIILGTVVFFFVFPFVEEISKFFATFVSNLKNRNFCDECTDPIIYSITAALGFAAAENLKVCFSILEENSVTLSGHFFAATTVPVAVLNTLIITIFIRFISAVFLHANAASIYGYFWGIGRLLKKKKHISAYLIAFGILLATLLHSCYNYLIMKTSENLYFAFGVILLLVVSNYIMSRSFKQIKSYQKYYGL